jgi:RNA polymerase sigma factor (TIGR02999 family)
VDSSHTVTEILACLHAGDRDATTKLVNVLYGELRNMARAHMSTEASGHTLQPTALVHEAYLRLLGGDTTRFENRHHFFAAAAEAMRRILVERARRARTAKRGGDRKRQRMEGLEPAVEEPVLDLIALDQALEQLQERDDRLSQVVKLRFFAGLTIEQTAELLGLTSRTVNRDWIAARQWLWARMTDEDSD